MLERLPDIATAKQGKHTPTLVLVCTYPTKNKSLLDSNYSTVYLDEVALVFIAYNEEKIKHHYFLVLIFNCLMTFNGKSINFRHISNELLTHIINTIIMTSKIL